MTTQDTGAVTSTAPENDLDRAVKALYGKSEAYSTFWRYYGGDHPLVYTARRLEEVFRNLDAHFAENWCAVVIDSARDRLDLQGFELKDKTAQAALERLWADLDLGIEADDAHLGALVCGESFVVAWPDRETGEPAAYYNDGRACHVFYEADNPRAKRFAVKWWDDDDGYRRVTLYYPDRLEYYRSAKPSRDNMGLDSWKAYAPFSPDGEAGGPVAENPYGVVPVFHFRTDLTAPRSDLVNAIPLQNGTNKLLSDMMVAAEFGAFPQRYVISQVETVGKLRNAPSEVWDLPASDGVGQPTSVGQLASADLGVYLEGISHLAAAIGITTRTPKHYFFLQGGDPSGEALIAMEAPLNKKCERYINRFTPVWRQLAAFLATLAGVPVEARDITPNFAKPETVQPLTQAQIRQSNVSSGLPLVTALRREGWTEAEIEAMEKDKQKEREASQDLTGAMLEQARRRFDRGPAPQGTGNGAGNGAGQPPAGGGQ